MTEYTLGGNSKRSYGRISSYYARQKGTAVRMVLFLTLVLSMLAAISPAYAAEMQDYAGQSVPEDLLATCSTANKDLGGRVWHDYNANGVKEAGEDLFIKGGITVNAYNVSNALVATTTVDSTGSYNFSGIFNSNSAVRLEFENLPSYLYEGAKGADQDTSVQFHASSTCGADLGVNDPLDYCDSQNPNVATPCLWYGTSNGTNANKYALLSWPYDATGHYFATGGSPTSGFQGSTEATVSQIGSTYGLAWQRTTGLLYVGAFQKRFSGYGPSGASAIYMVNPATNTIVGALNLATMSGGASAGTDPHTWSSTSDGVDFASADLVGKMSLGDVDISADMKTLYTINLLNRKIYAINVSGGTAASATILRAWDAPDACGASEHRPFALEVHNGRLWVGSVCENASNAYIHSFVPDVANAAPAMQLELTVPLGYNREAVNSVNAPNNSDGTADWLAWEPLSTITLRENNGEYWAPQPMLTDIEFDGEDIVLGLRDRFGDQSGYQNRIRRSTGNSDVANTGGDMLRACYVGTSFVLEGGAGCPPKGYNTQAGPGGKEWYYWDMFAVENSSWLGVNWDPDSATAAGRHWEITQGGLVQVPGLPTVMTTSMDPVAAFSGGVLRMVNDTGRRDGVTSSADCINTSGGGGCDTDRSGGYTLFFSRENPDTFAKTNGLGDLETLCAPAPIQIGNRIWLDADGDGIQDANENGISGVTVELWRDTDGIPNNGVGETLIGTTTTNGLGEYYFTVQPNTTYFVAVSANDPALTLMSLTVRDYAANAGDSDDEDSDGQASASKVIIPLQSGIAGQNNYTYDIGFLSTPVSLGSFVWQDLNNNGRQDSGEPGIPNATVNILNASGATVATVTTNSSGFYYAGGLAPGTYTVEVIVPSQYQPSNVQSSGDNQIANDSNIATTGTAPNSYRSSPITLTNNGEPTTASGETYPGDNQDDSDDNNGDMTIDFGFVPLTSLGSFVWHDLNHDGIQDQGEPGIPFATVTLLKSNGSPATGWDGAPIAPVTTGADGLYYFDQLPPGSYIVQVQVPTNYSPTASQNTADDAVENDSNIAGYGPTVGSYWSPVINLSLGGEVTESGVYPGDSQDDDADTSGNMTVDFGFGPYEPAAIGNYIWIDEDSNGYQDEGEPGIANVRVYLRDGSGNIVATTVTDSNGGYLFTNLVPGTYYVDVDETTLPAGMTQTTIYTNPNSDFGNQDQNTGPGDYGYPVTIGGASPVENLTADFGYNYNPTTDVNNNTNTGSIGDRVWVDVDGDGLQDPNEVGISGVTVTLTTAGADGLFGTADDVTVATTTTNATGNYLFDGLAPDAYVVTVTPPAGYTQTGDPDHFGTSGTNNDNKTTAPVVLGPGDVFLNADFGYQPPAAQNNSVGDTVWFDADADGVGPAGTPGGGDTTEWGIPGVTVALIRDTNGDGVWDADGADNTYGTSDDEPIVAVDVTDANGSYLFTGLPDGNYLVWVNDTDNVLASMEQTYDSDGIATPNISAVALDPASASSTGVSNLNQDFGYTALGQTTTPGSNGLIGDTVWFDLNNSGGATQQAGEPGIEGVVMELLDASNNVIATTTTDENGHYAFGGLPTSAGGVNYTVRVAASNFAANGVLEGMAETYAAGGAVGSHLSNTVTLTTAAPINLAQDFSYTTTSNPASLGNLVWLDSNADGTFSATTGQSSDPNAGTDDDEPVLGNVTIDLYRDLNGNGRVDAGEPKFSTTTTASAINAGSFGTNGTYLFTGLPGDSYVVNVTDVNGVLAGYWHSLGATATDNNSQVDPYAVTVAAGASNLTADFGYYVEPAAVGNFVWLDANGNGIQDAGEPGINNVTVTMVVSYANGTSTTLKTLTGDNPATTTVETGWYSFGNLLLDEDYRIGSTSTTAGATTPAHVISVATPAGFTTTAVGGADGDISTVPLTDSNDHSSTVAVPTQGLSNTVQQTASIEPLIAGYDFGFRVLDYGDLPNSYGTLLASNGARHAISNALYLGVCVDADLNGQPLATAAGDDNTASTQTLNGSAYPVNLPTTTCADDENGVASAMGRAGSWREGTVTGGMGGALNITIGSSTGATGVPQVFMDFGSGTLTAVTLRTITGTAISTPLATGNYTVYFDIPAGACPTGQTTDIETRVRLSSTGGLTSTGLANDGEVEDYIFQCKDSMSFAVTLAGFMAESTATGVQVTWETVSEQDNAGFIVTRSSSADGERVQVTQVASQAAGSNQGASYTITDSEAALGQTWWYWLEDVALDGTVTLHGPVSVLHQAPSAVTLGLLQAGNNSTALPLALVLVVGAVLLLTLLGWRWGLRRS